MLSRKRTNPGDLPSTLAYLGLTVTAANLNDFIARATKNRWAPIQILEELTRSEVADKAKRSFERRLSQARLGRFKPIADFDWNWPKSIDRQIIEQALTLDFIDEARNLILLGANGLGKTMITKNIAFASLLPVTPSSSAPPPNSSLTCSAILHTSGDRNSASIPGPISFVLTRWAISPTTPRQPTSSTRLSIAVTSAPLLSSQQIAPSRTGTPSSPMPVLLRPSSTDSLITPMSPSLKARASALGKVNWSPKPEPRGAASPQRVSYGHRLLRVRKRGLGLVHCLARHPQPL
jgi:hypothetical protein